MDARGFADAVSETAATPEAERLFEALRVVERRGRDLNPRRTQRPETVFETAAFDRSATPPGRPGKRVGKAEKEGFEPSKEVVPP